ncbi:uncharacterized protein LOC125194890 [Salvia hispanica]|uniref:uncharacterized protein LOC125194890 n=1 Tax=Salvia hispanica TaxID=49212 RepID=UPI0020090701|nr:uncharacterized protein LOC125194890 [Salvia hispanica]
MASNDEGWRNERNKSYRVASTSDFDSMETMSKQLDFLTSKLGNFNNYRPNQRGGNYNNYGNKLHPNLSYGNPNNALQPPPGFQVSNGQVKELKKEDLGDVLMAFMKHRGECMTQSNKRLDKPRQFPGNTSIDPVKHKECKAICATIQPNEVEKEVDEETTEDNVVEEEKKQPEPPRLEPYTPKIPFPSRIKKKVVDEKFEKLLDIFRKVDVNIPLVEALQQMPMYAMFLKDVISKKLKWVDNETVSMSENCSAIIQKKLPAKLKDPGSFNISCVIGDDKHTNALCDLGSSINLMPLSFFRKMKIGTLKSTRITLQMADRSVTYPKGIIEDVLVRVNEFIFPIDFVVLDMEEDRNVPLILGQPFLVTRKAIG